MKDLRTSPTGFDIELITVFSDDDGVADIYIKIGSAEGDAELTAEEAQEIADWFAGLAAEIRESEEATNATS